MSAIPKRKLITVEEYLAGEMISPTKHEYLDGRVFAMAGAGQAHNLIAANVLTALRNRLRGRPCLPWNSDMKVHIKAGSQERFYYPDVSVVCRPNPRTDPFHDEPVVVVEVLSDSTRRIDDGAKKCDYLTIASLAVYVMIEQDAAEVVAFRRTESGFVRELYEGIEAVLPLGEVGTELPLTEIYEDVEFSAESIEDEDG